MKRSLFPICSAAFLAVAGAASADIKVGVTLSTTGPVASLGIPEKNSFSLMPDTIGGQKIEYVVLDDASDTTSARRNAERLVTEENVDVLIGSSTTPNSLAMIEIAAQSGTPMISLGAGNVIVVPMDEQKKWVFKTPYNDSSIAEATARHMAQIGVQTAAYISFNDAYGESWISEFEKSAERNNIEIVAAEKYNRTDTSVTAQVLRVMSADPDAILVIGGGTPAVLPQSTLVERGYDNPIYQTSGVVNNDFLRVGGGDVEGTYLAAGPVIVVDELPDNHPVKAVAMDYKTKYEAAYGEGTLATFGANAWDAMLIVEHAIPKALKLAEPGTSEFRMHLRDAIEATSGLPLTHGVNSMSPDDHSGFSADEPIIITIVNGTWALPTE